jgi:hypothetical protein
MTELPCYPDSGLMTQEIFDLICFNHYLHELQEVLLQEVQPDDVPVPARGLSVPVEQKTENFFFTCLELHLGQLTAWFPKTSFSKSSPQLLHVYS